MKTLRRKKVQRSEAKVVLLGGTLLMALMGCTGKGSGEPSGTNATLSSEEVASASKMGIARGKVYYVSPSGDDSNSGLTAEKAFKTLQKAADLTDPGDTVLIMNGVHTTPYAGSNILSITRSGTATAPIHYKAHPGHQPKLKLNGHWNGIKVSGASHIIIEGLEIEGYVTTVDLDYAMAAKEDTNNPKTSHNCIFVQDQKGSDGQSIHPHHIVIRKNLVHHCGGGGIATDRADYITIEDNISHSNAWRSPYGNSGISIFHSYDIDNNRGYKNIVRRNITYNNHQHVPWYKVGKVLDGNGIIIDDLLNTQIEKEPYQGRTLVENNVTFNNGGSGIHCYSSPHVDIVNNSSYMNGAHAELEGEIFSNSCRDVRILNNVMYARKDETINVNYKNSDYINDFNLYFNTDKIPVRGENDRIGDPLYVDPANGDFRLKSGSPALASGTTWLAPDFDFNGIARPNGQGVERGAFESASVPVTIQAERMPQKEGGLHWDGEAWNLYQTGAISSDVRFPDEGTYIFEVTAAGQIAQNEGPVLEVLVNDAVVGRIHVSDRAFRSYRIQASVPAGLHKVSLKFVNDFYDPTTGQDRNVFIDKLSLSLKP